MNHRGFTLIELLATLSVMGIVAAMAMPNLMQARKSAAIAVEAAYAQNVYKAANAYLAEDVGAAALPSGADDCGSGLYVVGSYNGGTAPGTLTSCTLAVVGGHASVSYEGLSGSRTIE